MVDISSDDQVFLDFLVQLCSIYLKKTKNPEFPFLNHLSIILKNNISSSLRSKIKIIEKYRFLIGG